MIATLPNPPATPEQAIEQKLSACGLKPEGFTVKYSDELQSIEITIAAQAGASAKDFDCIQRASDNEIVAFKDMPMQKAFYEYKNEKERPANLAHLRHELSRHGWLAGLPKRTARTSDTSYYAALERHCGLKPGTYVRRNGVMTAPPHRQSKADFNKMSCLLLSVMYASAKDKNFRVGFIGHEVAPPQSANEQSLLSPEAPR